MKSSRMRYTPASEFEGTYYDFFFFLLFFLGAVVLRGMLVNWLSETKQTKPKSPDLKCLPMSMVYIFLQQSF